MYKSKLFYIKMGLSWDLGVAKEGKESGVQPIIIFAPPKKIKNFSILKNVICKLYSYLMRDLLDIILLYSHYGT